MDSLSSLLLLLLIGLVVLLLLIAFVFNLCGYIVHQTEGIVIERFGSCRKILTSGIHFVIPFIDNPRRFTWTKTYIDVDGSIRDENTTEYRVDLRESVFNFLPQEVYTKDTILLSVNSIMYYRIVDIHRAVYEVDDLPSAIMNVAQTQLKEVFGRMTFQECMTSQDQINEHMKQAFLPRFLAWGIKVERMELLDILPRSTIAQSMKKQMIAERERRSQFIIAEGQKTALRIRAEGTKVMKQNSGLAEQESTRKISEGNAQGRVELARAESQSLELVKSALQAHSGSQAQYMLAMRYLELLNGIGYSSAPKVLYLPYEADALRGSISSLNRVYGKKHTSDSASVPLSNSSDKKTDDFDELN